jgi:glutamate N-acetyltransferase/amino-acid N-acetyltransferase
VAGAAAAGMKPGGAADVAVIVSETQCTGAGVFTENRVRAAPVLYDQALLSERPGRLRGIVMNAQFANACTGPQGEADASQEACLAETFLELPPRCMLIMSTGLIGTQLPMDLLESGLKKAAATLRPDGGVGAARAIMTTDKRAKHVAVEVETRSGVITVGGIAKGAGMVHPNLATLLGVLTTDAEVDAAHLDALLRKIVDRTFNAITVDGDCSPNDTVLMLANGASEISIARDPEGWKLFEEAVETVARKLALMVVRDGEGATRFVELNVVGAGTEAGARAIGRSIARSALVKTALAGGDANWGRILAAAGASGFPIVPERLTLSARIRAADGTSTGDWLVLAREGATANADDEAAQAVFSAPEINVKIELGMGGAEGTVWTCDLSEEYVRINSTNRHPSSHKLA